MIKFTVKGFYVFVFITISATFLRCDTNEKQKTINTKHISYIKTIEYDGCEYIYDSRLGLSVKIPFTHKGNCKNSIHEWNK